MVATAAISVGALLFSGCKGSASKAAAPSDAGQAPPAAASSSPVVNAVPLSEDAIRKVVNPNNEQPYAGAVGSVRGTITAKGDVPPMLPDVVEKIPDNCKGARLIYGRLFREGMVRSLADALVTVTGYKGYVPAKAPALRVNAEGCAWDRRTYTLTFGQRIDVFSKDRESYLPKLLGGQMRASLYATPGGDASKLYPHVPGRYTLVDEVHPYVSADVFVFKYATHAVTGMDGKFEITGIPVGEVTVNALLPATMQTAEKKVVVEADKSVEVNLEIAFDKKILAPEPAKKPKLEIH